MMKFISSIALAVFIFIAAVFAVNFAIQCDHSEKVTLFSFQPPNSTAAHHIKTSCKNCNQYYTPKSFRGTPTDTTYLEVLKTHTDGEELVGGEVYTVTAIVTVGDFDFNKTRIRCKVENDDVIVSFSVEFLDGFEERVAVLEDGDEITFRGKFYDKGCAWTECELID